MIEKKDPLAFCGFVEVAQNIPGNFPEYRSRYLASPVAFPGIFTEQNAQSRQGLSEQMMDYWGQFAYSGDPAKGRRGNAAQWTRWKPEPASPHSPGQLNSAQAGPGQLIILDNPEDGGIRMQGNTISIGQLKTSLKADQSITDEKERCQLYAQMFFHSPDFIVEEYRALGCEQYPAADFPVL